MNPSAPKICVRFLSICIGVILCIGETYAATITITTSATWTASGIGATDNVIIKNGATLTVNSATAKCKNLQIASTANPNSGNGTLAFNSGSILTSTGVVTIGMGAKVGTLDMTSGGYLTCHDLAGTAGSTTFNAGSGSVELTTSGSLPSQITTYNNLIYNASGVTLNLTVGIVCNGDLTITAGIINTTGTNYSLGVYGNLTVSTSTTLTGNASAITLRGNFVHDGTFTIGTSSFIFDGTTTISGTGTHNFYDVTINSGKSLTLPTAMNVANNWTNNGGSVTVGTGTVTFNGTGAQAINGSASSQTFYNLTVSKTVATTLSVSGSTTSVTVNNYLQSQGNFTAPGTLNVSGDFTHNAGTFTHNSGLVKFNGGGAQALAGTLTSTFFNLEVNKSAGTLTQSVATATINNKLTMSAGTFDTGLNTLNGTGGVTATGGDLQSAVLATTLPVLTGASTAYNITGGKITLNGNGAQTLRPSISYYDIVLGNAGAKTISTITSIQNDITISGSATITGNAAFTASGTFNYNSSGSSTLTASTNISVAGFSQTAGTLIDNGNTITITGSTFSRTGGTFTATGKVLFNSASSQSIGGSSSTTFFKLYKQGAGTLSLSLAATVNNELNMSAGVIDASTFTFSGTAAVNISGGELKLAKLATTLPEFSGTYTISAGKVTFNGAGSQTVYAQNYFNIDLSNSGTKTFQAGTTAIAGTLTVAGGVTPDLRTNNTTISYNGSGAQTVNALNYKNLTLATSGTKTFASGTTKIQGSITTSGTAVGDALTNSTTVEFDGTAAAQSVASTAIPDFYNLNVSSTFGSGLTSTGAINLWNTMTLGASSIYTNSGGSNSITLKSTASNTARIATIPGTASYNGNIIMEKYIPSIPYYNGGYYHIIGKPNACTYSGLKYDETQIGPAGSSYSTGAITTGVGAFKDYGAGSSTTTFTTAAPNKGTIVVPTTYTLTGYGTSADGWNLICNPYPCEILWSPTGITRTNVNASAYLWNGTQYVTILTTDIVPTAIPSGQGFWVKGSAAGSGSVQFGETCKVATNPTYYQTATSNPSLLLRMSGNGFDDHTDFRFNPLATANFDPDYDAVKLDGISAAPHLASFTLDTVKTSINSYPSLTQNISIPVVARCANSGIFTMHVDAIANFPQSSCVYLEDLETGNTYDLKTISSFDFNVSGNISNLPRFTLHIGPPISLNINNATCSGGNYLGTVIANGQANGPWLYTWHDSSGAIIRITPYINQADTLLNAGAGNYTVNIVNSSGSCTNTSESFSVLGLAPVLPHANINATSCFGTADGSIDLSPDGGNGPYTFLWNTGSVNEDIQSISAGTYSVVITDANLCSVQDTFHIHSPAAVIPAFTVNANPVVMNGGVGLVQFTNNSSGASNFSWDFGDGSPYSALASPAYFYTHPGVFTASLKAINGVCENVTSQNITILESPNGLENLSQTKKTSIYFSNHNLILSIHSDVETATEVDIVNVLGQVIWKSKLGVVKDLKNEIDFSSNPDGIYFVLISQNEHQTPFKISYTK